MRTTLYMLLKTIATPAKRRVTASGTALGARPRMRVRTISGEGIGVFADADWNGFADADWNGFVDWVGLNLWFGRAGELGLD